MRIEAIIFPHIFTDSGERLMVADCIGQPRVGNLLEQDGEKYRVIQTSDFDCIGGACGLDRIGGWYDYWC